MVKKDNPQKAPKIKESWWLRYFDFFLSVKSWKRSIISPLKPLKRYGPALKRDVNATFSQFNHLEPATDKEDLELAIKKTSQSMKVYGVFAFIFAALAVKYGDALFTEYQSHTAFQFAVFTLITAVYIFRFYTDHVVHNAAKNQLDNTQVNSSE